MNLVRGRAALRPLAPGLGELAPPRWRPTVALTIIAADALRAPAMTLPDPTADQTLVDTRRHDLDWVRIAAFGLLILYHTGMYYVSWDWHVKSPMASTTIEPLMLLSSPWRLSLLFFVSGCATAFLLGKAAPGGRGSLRTRARRLLLPLLAGMLVIVPPQAYFEVVEKMQYRDGYLSFWARYLAFDSGFCRADGRCLTLPTWNHLWFVAYLFTYTALLALLLRVAPRALPWLSALLARRLADAVGWGVLLWPVLGLALIRLPLVGRFPSTHNLVWDWYNHALYGSVFLFGVCIARQVACWEALRRLRWLSLGLALAAYAYIAWYFNVYTPGLASVPEWVRQSQRVIYAADQWCAIAAILGFARQWSPGDSATKRYLGEAVFPFYIVHQTAIVVLAQWLKPLALAPRLEALLIVAGTFAACFASFALVRRVRVLRPWFGLAARPVAARPVAAPADHPGHPAREAAGRQGPASIASP